MLGSSLNYMPYAIVIGAGVVGAATAHALTVAGAQVVVLEGGQVAAGCSAATFAVDITRVKTPPALFDLAQASVAEHARLQRADADQAWVHPTATLEWEETQADRQRLRERIRRLHRCGYPAEWLAPQRVRAVEPALAMPPQGSDEEPTEVAFYPEGGWYDPPAFVRALLRRAKRQGASVHVNDSVIGMTVDDGRITEVCTASGQRLTADVVVNCAGPQAAGIAALAGAELSVRQIAGMVAITTPVHTGLQTILAAPDLNARPHLGGRVMLHSWLIDRELEDTPASRRRALAEELLRRAGTLIPMLSQATVEASRVGLRPVPPDGLPIVGFPSEVANLYTVVSHSAIHLAPILGVLAARELTGDRQHRLDPFRPTRFRPGADRPQAVDESTRTMLARIEASNGCETADVR